MLLSTLHCYPVSDWEHMMSMEQVQGRQRELRWPGIWGDAQCHGASLLKPEVAEPRTPEHRFGGSVGKYLLSGADGGPAMHQ